MAGVVLGELEAGQKRTLCRLDTHWETTSRRQVGARTQGAREIIYPSFDIAIAANPEESLGTVFAPFLLHFY